MLTSAYKCEYMDTKIQIHLHTFLYTHIHVHLYSLSNVLNLCVSVKNTVVFKQKCDERIYDDCVM